MRSQRIQKKEVNFKIKPNEIGKYSTADIDLDGVSQAFLGKFTDKEIERAKELKAKQKALHEENPDHVPETAYSDEFYLNYAKSLSHEEHMGRLLEIFKNRVSGCEIQDPYWSQYSYEEILQMEQDGYQIPQDVLEWAHAQQQSDVTDYIVMSDGAETDDASSTSDVTGSDELTKLRAQSLNDIAKIEKAEKETEKEYDEYRRTEGKAKSVQARSAFFQDIEFKKLEEKTKEWKKLNEKSQAGKLRKSEESRFNQLTKELQGANSGIVSDIESNAADLDEFLGQLNKLSEKLSENEEIVTKAVQNAMDLTSIERQYDPSKLPVPTKGIRIDGNGLSTSTLYGIKTEDIAKVAIDKSRDLTASDIYTTNYISGRKTQKLTAFSSEYSEKVKEATDKTKETVGVSENESSEEKDEKTNPKNIPESRNNVTIEFSAPNSVEATETTVAATTEMLFAQAKTIKEEANLKDKVKQAKKDVTELEQKVNTAQTKHQANLSH